jgi:small GTP-binding protein
MDQARDALFHADHPFLIVLVGPFNAGKSTIINALIGQPVLEVGATPTTTKIAILRHGPDVQRLQAGEVETVFDPSPLLERISLVDTPGLESVFKQHDQVTQRFLHRADIVLLVMPATQAMSFRNVEYMQSLRSYGKRVIIIINQIDALDAEEQKTLKEFVAEQSKLNLGFVPPIWMLSAKLALEAQQAAPRNEELWQASGFEQVERYVNEALGDLPRIRQKLETPLQIARNVTTVANAQVRDQQNALADFRRSAQNVRRQIEAATREQQAAVRQTVEEVSSTFAEAITRGREAIADIFQFSKILSVAIGSIIELLGLARLIRRFGATTPAQKAFDVHKVNEPLDQLPGIVDRLGPRLEGRDVKDIDDLIAYTRREIAQLPGALQQKIVGKLEVPTTYDRSIIRDARTGIMTTIDKARTVEFKHIDQAVRNWLVFLGAYEFVIIIAAVIAAIALSGSQNGNWLLLLLIIIVLWLAGLFLLPLRGALMAGTYGRRMLGIEAELEKSINRVAQEQIEAGTRMRNDAVAPFMRLVDAQISQVDQLKTELEGHEQGLVTLEKELGGLRE